MVNGQREVLQAIKSLFQFEYQLRYVSSVNNPRGEKVSRKNIVHLKFSIIWNNKFYQDVFRKPQ